MEVGDIIEHKRTGLLYRIMEVQPVTEMRAYKYYWIETALTHRKSGKNEYQMNDDFKLVEKEVEK